MLVPGAVGLAGSEVATGLLASLLFSQNPRNLLFDVAPFDAATLLAVLCSECMMRRWKSLPLSNLG